MIREIVEVTDENYTIKFPQDFLGQKVTIIAYKVDAQQKSSTQKTLEQLNLELQGLTTNLSDFKFSRDEANDYD